MVVANAIQADQLPLRVRGLSVTTAQGRVLASASELDIAPGAAVGISGPSGAGKSTLLFALAGLLPRATGQIAWGDTNLLDLREGARRAFAAQHFGMIFQDFLLFDELSAQDNAAALAMFSPRQRRADIKAAGAAHLKALGLSDPDRTVSSFSGGERQRVAVARALAGAPSVIFADEPTASLDRAAADLLTQDLVDRTRQTGATLICVSHDAALLDQMDRVLTMADAEVQND